LEEEPAMDQSKLKKFSTFLEQDGGLPTSAPTNTVGNQKIAGLGSDFPPVPAKNKLNIKRRKTAKLLNNKVIENTDSERK
jgi:hypothetical protein